MRRSNAGHADRRTIDVGLGIRGTLGPRAMPRVRIGTWGWSAAHTRPRSLSSFGSFRTGHRADTPIVLKRSVRLGTFVWTHFHPPCRGLAWRFWASREQIEIADEAPIVGSAGDSVRLAGRSAHPSIVRTIASASSARVRAGRSPAAGPRAGHRSTRWCASRRARRRAGGARSRRAGTGDHAQKRDPDVRVQEDGATSRPTWDEREVQHCPGRIVRCVVTGRSPRRSLRSVE
jgi:hypothetical protein